jgi:hypothetical protein
MHATDTPTAPPRPMIASTASVRTAPPASLRRPLVLIALFLAAALLLANMAAPHAPAAPRWPTDPALFAVDGWSVAPESVDASRPGMVFVTRTYTAADGARATVVISTSPMAKSIYRAGADVPFLGNGYTVEPAPPDLVPPSGQYEAFVARRTGEAWLQLASYGERRGAFGTGALAWGLSAFDALLGQPNNYYLARVLVAFDDARAADQARAARQLAATLLPRLASFYAS